MQLEDYLQNNIPIKNIMYCRDCGQEIDEDAVYCKYCGTKQQEVNMVLAKTLSLYKSLAKKYKLSDNLSHILLIIWGIWFCIMGIVLCMEGCNFGEFVASTIFTPALVFILLYIIRWGKNSQRNAKQ